MFGTATVAAQAAFGLATNSPRGKVRWSIHRFASLINSHDGQSASAVVTGSRASAASRPVPMVVVQVICPSLPVSCVQSARLPRYLCIEALDRVNLLVAAGMSDPLFHYVKRAVAAHRTNRDE